MPFFLPFFFTPIDAFVEGEKEKENVCKMSIICSLSSSYMSLQMKEIPLVIVKNKKKKRTTIELREREIVVLH
jgi:hypothetical protein